MIVNFLWFGIYNLQVEDELAEFAKMTMDFWHYFKLETWNDNNRLVFKMNQADFDKLVEKTSENYKHSITTDNLEKLFGYIVELFSATLDSETKKYFNYELLNQKNKPYKINWIKTEKVMILKYLREMEARDNRYANSLPYFFYNAFPYSFFVNPNQGETNIDDGKYKFLQIIEFKVE